jgi:spore photoproduct lyase
MVTRRLRKSSFVRLFDKTPDGVVCPHFYELVLSNGCPFGCTYCYLKLTFRGNSKPTLFTNDWTLVQREIEAVRAGVFSTGELADSLAVIPPLLQPAIEYFRSQQSRYLLLVTKSSNTEIMKAGPPTKQVIVSFSVNSSTSADKYEIGPPTPMHRLEAAQELKDLGWRVRIRIDPVIIDSGIEPYKGICKEVARLQPELVTVGTLRQYPGLFRFANEAPRRGLSRSWDGRMRYSISERLRVYEQIADWLGFQPSLCKETDEVWARLGWEFKGCNCTEGADHGCTSLDFRRQT